MHNPSRPRMDYQFSRSGDYETTSEKIAVAKINERNRIISIIFKEKKLNEGDVDIKRVLNNILNEINLFP